jgi:diaminopimelate epimerase
VVPFIKAHAYGNDFLYVSAGHIAAADAARAAQRICSRHRGVGADGLILYTPTPRGASMTLLNADGSAAELSGNGLRGLAAILIRGARPPAARSILTLKSRRRWPSSSAPDRP